MGRFKWHCEQRAQERKEAREILQQRLKSHIKLPNIPIIEDWYIGWDDIIAYKYRCYEEDIECDVYHGYYEPILKSIIGDQSDALFEYCQMRLSAYLQGEVEFFDIFPKLSSDSCVAVCRGKCEESEKGVIAIEALLESG